MSEKRTGEPLTVESVKARAHGVLVVLSNGEKLTLSPDSFTEFHIYAGKELSPEELDGVFSYAEQDEAYDLALRYLGHDAYSSKGIYRKLIGKGYEKKVVVAVVERLLKAGLLDDEQFALSYAMDVADLRQIGHNRVLYDLRVKGVSESILKRLEFPREEELRKAKSYAESLDKRYYRTPSARRVLKIYAALIARGFDEDVSHEAAASSVTASDPKVERAELDKAYNLAKAKYSRKYSGYELRTHIYAYLVRKGFPYDEIQTMMEDEI